MMNFIRSICITISSAFFTMIPVLYSLFHGMAAEPTMFDTNEIRNLTNNIYTLVSVVMLFAFASRAISAIVNPDNLWDSKKGVSSVIKRSLIALVLLVSIPFAFEYFYEFQTKIINNNLIEKVILGLDFSQTTLTEEQQEELEQYLTDDSISDDTKDQIRKFYARNSAAYWIGQSLAQTTLKSVLYPNPSVSTSSSSTDTTNTTTSNEDVCVEGGGVTFIHPVKMAIKSFGMFNPTWFVKDVVNSFKSGNVNLLNGIVTFNSSDSLCENYNLAISQNIDYINAVVPSINNTTGTFMKTSNDRTSEHYVLEFTYWGLLSVIVSGVIVYMLVLFCIDSAVRLIKLAFLQITAPISIMAYVYSGSDVLKKWGKEVGTTAISFFLRVAAIGFLALVLLNLDNFANNLPGYYNREAKIFIIIGSLIFAKKVPETIERILGVRINLQGGLRGRLGSMMGVGAIAKGAVDSLIGKGKAAVTGTAGLATGLALGGLAAGAKAGINAIDNKKFNGEGLEKLKNTTAVKALTAAGSVSKAGFSQHGKIGATVNAMKGAYDKSVLGSEIKAYSDLERQNSKKKAQEERNVAMGFNIDGSTKKGNGVDGKKKAMSYVKGKFGSSENSVLEKYSTISEAGAFLSDANKGQADSVTLANTVRQRRLSSGDKVGADATSTLLEYTQTGRYLDSVNQAKLLKDKGIIDDSEYNKFVGYIKSQERGLEGLKTLVKITPELDGIESIRNLVEGKVKLNATNFSAALDAMNGNTDKHIAGVLKGLEDTIKGLAPEGSTKSNQINELIDAIYRHNAQIIKDNKASNDGTIKDQYKPIAFSTTVIPTTPTSTNSNAGVNDPGITSIPTGTQQNITSGINGGTIHVDSIQTNNISTNAINGQNVGRENIKDEGFTMSEGGVIIPKQDIRQESSNISSDESLKNLESAINKVAQEQQQTTEAINKGNEQAATDAKRLDNNLRQNTQAQKDATESINKKKDEKPDDKE